MNEEQVCARCGMDEDESGNMFEYPCICNDCLAKED